MSMRPLPFASLLFCLCVLISGCAMNVADSSSTATMLPHISGVMHGGQQPVSGATIQLYAANMTANQGASTALGSPVTTDSSGNFTFPGGAYTCPGTNPLVYMVATNGNPGLGGTVNNTDLGLMTILGTCSTLTSSTYVIINELTTVASIEVLAPFMTDYAHVGAAPSNPTALASAFEGATSLVNFSTGQFVGGANSLQIPEVQWNTLANIVAACVNTSGGTSGSATPCGTLLADTSASNTIGATLAMVQSPGTNAAALYGLILGTPPFQPYFTTVPTDFSSSVGYTLPSSLSLGTIAGGVLDSNGHIWLYQGGYSYNTVADTSTDNPGSILVYDGNFNLLFTVSSGTGGMYYPYSLSADASGHVFAINSNNTVSEFASNGSALSPSGGWSTGIAASFSPTGSGNGYVSNSQQVGTLYIDALNNIWADTPVGCYVEMNSSGTVITPSGNFCSTVGTLGEFFATDGSGNAWDYAGASISKVNAAGAFVVSAPSSQGCFYPQSSVSGGNYDLATVGIAYDHIHNQLWGYSQTGAGAVTNAGAAVFCDSGSSTLPVIPAYASTSTTPGAGFSTGSLLITSAVLDGAGNLWFTTGGLAASGVVGTVPGTFTGTVKYSSYLGEISPTGTLLTTYNAGSQIYGLQPAGLGVNVNGTSTNGSVLNDGSSVSLLGVDSGGNIWAVDYETNKFLKITGLAVANTVNY